MAGWHPSFDQESSRKLWTVIKPLSYLFWLRYWRFFWHAAKSPKSDIEEPVIEPRSLKT